MSDIIKQIITMMEFVEQTIDMTGSDKKIYVLSNLKVELGDEIYNRYYFLILGVIDFICSVSKNGLKTSINKGLFSTPI